MGTSGWLATYLDARFLVFEQAALIHQEGTLNLPLRTGVEVARELGGRKLIRYMHAGQVGRFRQGSSDLTYTTPTPYSPEEASSWLVLPAPTLLRTHALILEPTLIPWIQGPQWVAMGSGIQYLLPQGFPAAAIIVPGAHDAQWEIVVR